MASKRPKGLGYQARKLWDSVIAEFDLDTEPDKLRILFDACKLADVIDQLEKGMAGEPLTVLGSARQLTVHPLISELRFTRAQLASLLGKLNFSEDER